MATLTAYQQIVRRLMGDQTFARFDDFDLRDYVNIGRAQVAADGECVRATGQTTVNAGLGYLPLSGIPLAGQYLQPLVVRNAMLNGVKVDIRPWDWFVTFSMNNPQPTPVAAHQGQGSFADIYVSSLNGGNLWLDVVALPQNLVDDTTPDAIPFPWVDAVAFYATYYAYMAAQQQNDADLSMLRYRDTVRRARGETTSTNLPDNDPGGLGARIAALKVALGALPPQPGPSPAPMPATATRRMAAQ